VALLAGIPQFAAGLLLADLVQSTLRRIAPYLVVELVEGVAPPPRLSAGAAGSRP